MEEITLWSKDDESETNKGQKQERGQWTNLPNELLALILSNLFAGDRVTFLAVCRSWQSVSVIAPTLPLQSSQTPCLMILPKNKFFHPTYNMSSELEGGTEGFPDAVIRASKHNWLLMTQGEAHVFFFNPFTKVRIDLPDYRTQSYGMTFTSSPFSSNCVITGVRHMLGSISIFRLKVGEDEWEEHRYDRKNFSPVHLSHCSAVKHKGRYYFMGSDGGLVIFDPRTLSCHWSRASMAIQKLLSSTTCQRYMMEHDGNLLSVFMASDGRWLKVYKLGKGCCWEVVKKLRDKSLYVSRAGSFCAATTVRGTSNNIYLPRLHDNSVLFYSFASKKYHTINGGAYDTIVNSKMPLHTTWMMEPRTRMAG